MIAMTKTDELLNEFAERQYPHLHNKIVYNICRKRMQEKFISDLTALISENYYPKEFLLWTHSQDYWKFDMVKCVWIPDEPVAFQYEITTDELFNYWKENEK